MIHFVYVVGRGSLWHDNELRYSLRSLGKNFRTEFDVTIVGRIPSWVVDVSPIVMSDAGDNPIVNVARKLKDAAPYLPEQFVLMNDDFYFMKPISTIPVEHGGAMSVRLAELRGRASGLYVQAFRDTFSALQRNGIAQPLRYDRHTPFPMSTFGLEEIFSRFPDNLLLKSLYGNFCYRGGGKLCPDVKTSLWGKRNVFWSTSRALLPDAKRMLQRTFPERSMYERA